jgi:hypothetical protein
MQPFEKSSKHKLSPILAILSCVIMFHRAIGQHSSAAWSVTRDVGKHIILCSRKHQVLSSHSKVRSAIKCSASGERTANVGLLLFNLTLDVINSWHRSHVAFNYIHDQEWTSLCLPVETFSISNPLHLYVVQFQVIRIRWPVISLRPRTGRLFNTTRPRTHDPISEVRILTAVSTGISSAKRAPSLRECATVIAEVTEIRPAD